MKLLMILMVLAPWICRGQGPYAPPAGQPGSTAIHKDSSVFSGWATSCTLERGLQNIADPSGGPATHGSPSDATGKADAAVVSLGDSGTATCSFSEPLHNGPGPDFAVFENSFSDDYLELAFVEVSSDGERFVRFPAISLTPDTSQTAPFGSTDATNIYNLAGKYRGGYGTPFDLEELKDSANLDINAVTHIRLIDVIGAIDSSFTTHDSQENPINDPYPTAFASGGFDFDAVGIIHSGAVNLEEHRMSIKTYPNPAKDFLMVTGVEHSTSLKLFNSNGQVVHHQRLNAGAKHHIPLQHLRKGLYLMQIGNGKSLQKLIVE